MGQTARTRLQAPGSGTGGGGGPTTVIVGVGGVPQGSFGEIDFHNVNFADEGGGVAGITVPNSIQTEFTFQPGGVAGNGVYTTWPALYADLSAVKVPTTVFIDNRIVSPAVIPVGIYDMTLTSISGITPSDIDSSTLQFANGAVFTKPISFSYLILESTSASPVMNYNAGLDDALIFNFVGFGAVASTLISLTGNENLGLNLNSSFIGHNFFSIDATSSLTINFKDNSSMQVTDAVTGPAGAQLFLLLDASSGGFLANQTGFAGTVTQALDDIAENIGYNPTTLGDWAVPPTQVRDALDELAKNFISSTFYTITPADITAKQIIIVPPPRVPFQTNAIADIKTGVATGGPLQYGVDFTFTGGNAISWNGFALDGIIVAGNLIRVSF